MAAPHISGAILLLREAFPNTTGTEVKMALYMSATDLGDEGEDNTFGMKPDGAETRMIHRRHKGTAIR